MSVPSATAAKVAMDYLRLVPIDIDADDLAALRSGHDGTIIRRTRSDDITLIPTLRSARCAYCGRSSPRDGAGSCVGCGAS